MGCDYLVCEKCVKVLKNYGFLQCVFCIELLPVCEECFDVDKNKFANYKDSVIKLLNINNKEDPGLIICDNCIKAYVNIDDLDMIDIFDNFDNYDIDKISLDKNIFNLKKNLK